MTKKSGLGRGLSSLLEETLETGTGKVHELSVLDIEPNPKQPRKNFDQEALRTLADSISEVGVLSPILVRQKENGLYEIIAGERRWRASKLAGKKKIPAIVKTMKPKKSWKLPSVKICRGRT